MALQQIPGFTGVMAVKASSMDKRAIGKFTDSNHIGALHLEEPAMYDKKYISLYTQTSLYSNDLQNMINQATPFYIDSNSDYWQWKVGVPYQFPTIIEIPASTLALATPGIDGQEFEIVVDKKVFVSGDVITSHRMFAPNFYVVADPIPYNSGWLLRCSLITSTPLTDYVSADWLKVGLELEQVDNMIGEFDTQFSGLDEMGDSITLYESLSAGFGVNHKITDWADARTLRDGKGQPLDIQVYAQYRRNEMGKTEVIGTRWEPVVDMMARKKMLSLNLKRMLWGKQGTAKTDGSRQEVKKSVSGIYQQMRNNGNLVRYNRGEFSINLMRDVFGDLFYRRVSMGERRVKVYTNEAGFEVFRTAAKQDLLNSGLTVIADDRFIQGSGQNMVVNYAFESVITMETGKITLVHLTELDLPQTNSEFGQNKKSTPVFMVFDVSPDGDGTPKNNIRQVRHRNRPSMTWGYIDGTVHHLGFAASQGMQSASKDPWYELWMKDRSDVFIEDLSRTVLIEEIPQF